MKVSLSWLKRYVDIDVPVSELCDKMIMSGFEVESIEDLSKTMRNVVVGKITKIEKHPDADKLQICMIDVGEAEPLQIVTGADNVFEGALVPVAKHDSDLPNGVHIKKGKLRGVASAGMLCSGEELCLKEEDYKGAEVYGILILQGDWAPGTDMREVLGLMDTVIDFKITANRPDCLSVLGIAREAAVAIKKEFRPPVPSYRTIGGDISEHIRVTVEDYDLCPRYYGRVVKNVRIGESPEWLKRCLKAAGMRPISNIVDITNFVMLETGQPMHAFDLAQVRGKEIIVRRARDGEPVTTLDGKQHQLTSEMLVIGDAEAPSCIAGVMGSADSEITENTKDIFFECAKFRRDSVRKTARALGMRTESSTRFEKGIDVINTEYAMERALSLIDELNAGDIIDGVIDKNTGLPAPREIRVEPARITELLGVDIPLSAMVDILNSLGIATEFSGTELCCQVPSFREDIEGRADLAEEVMRIYGYDHITATAMKGDIIRGRKDALRINHDRLKGVLTANGLREITTYSFVSGKAVDQIGLSEDDARRKTVKILNPLGEEYSNMRTQLVSSMLTVLSTNYNRKNARARLFEISKVYLPKALPITEQPVEQPEACIGIYGKEEDFYSLKGIVEAVFARFGITNLEYTRSAEPYLHPGRQATARMDGVPLATFGEVHPSVAENFDMEERVYLAELHLADLYRLAQTKVLYQPLPRFPAALRDITVTCDDDLPVAAVEKLIRTGAGKHLEKIELFDVYKGSQIAQGKKSVSFSIVLRAQDRTLTVEEADHDMNKILQTLAAEGITLR